MMKIVKLDNRYKAFKQGFIHALKFEQYGSDCALVEQSLHERYKTQTNLVTGQYYGKFGRTVVKTTRNNWGLEITQRIPAPYWIYLRNEADITLLLLLGVIDGHC